MIATPRERLAVLAAAAAYGWARIACNGEYGPASWDRLLALSAPLPFGHRVLVPLLVRPLVDAGVPVAWCFGVVEAIAFAVAVLAFAACVVPWCGRARARWCAVLVAVVLVLVYVVPRRWALFYPWDGPAVAAVLGGIAAVVHGRWRLALAATVLGAIDRETAILVPLCALAIHYDAAAPARRIALAWAQALLAVWIVARVTIAMALPENPGPALHFTVGDGHYRVLANLRWLARPGHWLTFAVYCGVLPLLWPFVRRRVPTVLHRVGLVGVGWFLASLVVANVDEPRAWGEAVVLASLPAAAGSCMRRDAADARTPWARRIDRLALPAMLAAFVAFVFAVRTWSLLPVAQWPMPR